MCYTKHCIFFDLNNVFSKRMLYESTHLFQIANYYTDNNIFLNIFMHHIPTKFNKLYNV